MRKLLIFFLLIPSIAQSQDGNKKYWSDGELTWHDFKTIETAEGSGFELNYQMGFEQGKEQVNGMRIHRLQAYAYMDTEKSWVDSTEKTDVALRYNQLLFDLIELYRRKLQFALDTAGKRSEVQPILSTVFNQLDEASKQIRNETRYGDNFEDLQRWEMRIRQGLKQNAIPVVPEHEVKEFGFGLHAGLGSSTFTSTLDQYPRAPFNFLIGFDFAYGKYVLNLNFTGGFSKLKRTYPGFINWNKGQSTTYSLMEFSLGHRFFEETDVVLTPFAGFAISGFTTTHESTPQTTIEYEAFSPNVIAGLQADYKIMRMLDLTPDALNKHGDRNELSIRARVYVNRIYFQPDFEGYAINFSIGADLFGRPIELKRH